eukprot:g5325.t1
MKKLFDDDMLLIPTTSTLKNTPVGGHGSVSFSGDGTFVRKRHGKLKTLRSAENWYKAAQNTRISKWMPKYKGISLQSLVMEDLTDGLDPDTATIMDIKLGTRSFAEDVSVDTSSNRYVKKLREQFGIVRLSCSKKEYMHFRDSKSTTVRFGFRVTALRAAIRDTASSSVRHVAAPVCGDRVGLDWYDRMGHETGVLKTLLFFVQRTGGKSFEAKLLCAYAGRIRALIRDLTLCPLFLKNECIGTSVLLLHDKNAIPRLAWIDFSHIYEPTRGDAQSDGPCKKDGILHGLRSLLKFFEKASSLCVAAGGDMV